MGVNKGRKIQDSAEGRSAFYTVFFCQAIRTNCYMRIGGKFAFRNQKEIYDVDIEF